MYVMMKIIQIKIKIIIIDVGILILSQEFQKATIQKNMFKIFHENSLYLGADLKKTLYFDNTIFKCNTIFIT